MFNLLKAGCSITTLMRRYNLRKALAKRKAEMDHQFLLRVTDIRHPSGLYVDYAIESKKLNDWYRAQMKNL